MSEINMGEAPEARETPTASPPLGALHPEATAQTTET